MILPKSNGLYNHFSHYFASSFHKCTARSPWSRVRFEPHQAHHSRSMQFPKLSGMRGEQGTGTACWGWLCWVWWHRGHRKCQQSSEFRAPPAVTLVCSVLAAGGMGRMGADAKSLPFMLQHTRAAVGPGARQTATAATAATWPFCTLREKNN